MKKNMLKNLGYKTIGQKIKHPQLIPVGGLEKAIGFATPIATVLSVGSNPEYNVAQRVISGPIDTATGFYDAAYAIATNEGVRDFLSGAGMKVIDLVGNFGENVINHPGKTLAAALVTYVGGRVVKKGIEIVKNKMQEKYAIQDGYA